jgi:hypothetical protein
MERITLNGVVADTSKWEAESISVCQCWLLMINQYCASDVCASAVRISTVTDRRQPSVVAAGGEMEKMDLINGWRKAHRLISSGGRQRSGRLWEPGLAVISANLVIIKSLIVTVGRHPNSASSPATAATC